MARCEICDSKTKTRKVNIEGGNIEACFYCVARTKSESMNRFRNKTRRRYDDAADRPKRLIIDNYASRIRQEREKNKITQKDLAQKVDEHESVIAKIEQGRFRPNFAVARKIERLFKITLIKQADKKKEHERQESKDDKQPVKNKLEKILHTEKKKKPSHGCTIADYLNMKK